MSNFAVTLHYFPVTNWYLVLHLVNVTKQHVNGPVVERWGKLPTSTRPLAFSGKSIAKRGAMAKGLEPCCAGAYLI